jgi:hypothetical protein
MKKKDAAGVGMVLWSFILAMLLFYFLIWDLWLYLVLCIIGALVLTYVIQPLFTRPRFIRNLGYMSWSGLFIIIIIAGYIILSRFQV